MTWRLRALRIALCACRPGEDDVHSLITRQTTDLFSSLKDCPPDEPLIWGTRSIPLSGYGSVLLANTDLTVLSQEGETRRGHRGHAQDGHPRNDCRGENLAARLLRAYYTAPLQSAIRVVTQEKLEAISLHLATPHTKHSRLSPPAANLFCRCRRRGQMRMLTRSFHQTLSLYALDESVHQPGASLPDQHGHSQPVSAAMVDSGSERR